MKIVHNTFAVFWTRKGWNQQFHADMYADTASQAYHKFIDLFPYDVVCSIRDKSGKFCKFK